MGELPELGKNTQGTPRPAPKTQKNAEPKPTSIIAPRVSTGYSVNRYSDYLTDLKEMQGLLAEIKAILEGLDTPKNKIQFFNAKTFLFNLYMEKFTQKYGKSQEKYYESYKQLVSLNNYLKKVGANNANEAVKPINTVLEIISEAN